MTEDRWNEIQMHVDMALECGPSEYETHALRDCVEAIKQLKECLADLYDHQNGCPLPKYEARWTAAMKEAERLLEYRSQPALKGEA